ncbi:MAG: hypothetical protein ACO3VO_00040 [Ilumatobacteraceae bacterium]
MSDDTLLRTLAIGAAVALLAAPYWEQIVGAARATLTAAGEHRATIARVTAAGLIVAAAWGKLPMPDFMPVVPAVSIDVPEPSPDLLTTVEPVRKALADLSAADRALWAATWAKAAVVVEADGTSSVEAFRDTAALRLFTTVALDIAWRRLGKHQPGSVDGLREGVEAAMRSVLGLDAVPVTPQMRASYADVAKAIAWAGLR